MARACLVLVATLLLGVRGAAAADMVAVVRVATPLDDEILGRVRGHVSDLDVSLVTERGPLEGKLGAEIEAARGLAQARQARVVVWFEARGDTLLVQIAEPGVNKVLVRRLAPDSGADSRSAELEAAAVVVRSALQALAAGGQIGIAADALLEPTPSQPVRAHAGAPLGWRAGAGWQVALDGQSPRGEQALAVRIGGQQGRVGLALVATAGLPSRLRDALSAVDLARHSLGVALSVSPLRRRALEVAVDASCAGGAYFRATVEGQTGVMATPARITPVALLGADVRATWTPSRLAGALGIELGAGADAVLGAPELVYTTGTSTRVRNRLWPVQPRVTLSLVIRTP